MSKRTTDYIPRTVMSQQIDALQDRCTTAERSLIDVLNHIDPELLVRHGYDWLLAVRELLG